MLLQDKAAQDQLLEEQVGRILHSDELRTSEVLRQLLKFLLEKTILGEADQLKEYTVAIDGLGKPQSYDPQHNSAVRIQVGRLRLKLAEYYREAGKYDPVVVCLPKGRFKLTIAQRLSPPESLPLPPQPMPIASPAEKERTKTIGLGPLGMLIWLGLTMAVALGVFLLTERWDASGRRGSASLRWTPELESLWGPFTNAQRPLIVSIEDPLFVQMRSAPGIYYRDRSLNQWQDALTSPAVSVLRNTLKSDDVQPSRYYTAFGEADISYLLGKLLGPRGLNVSLVKTSQLSFQQLADNNVLFVGVQNLFFDEKMQEMPLAPQLAPVLEGVRNTHPKPGEPALFADQYSTAPNEQGIVYALVTHLPGPLGSNDVESFTSNRSAGYVGAVEWFTDPNFARVLVTKLKETSGGHMPRYYQVLLKVKFKDDVPVETTYVLGREMRL
jgi:hypothetical protein